MIKNRTLQYIAFLVVLSISCAVGIQGAKKMEKVIWPVASMDIDFKDRVISIFPVSSANKFGMIAGKLDHETLRIGAISGKHINETVFPKDIYEPADEIGTCIDDHCDQMYMSAKRILSVIDLRNKKHMIEYYGMGNVLKNRYLKTKLINGEEKLVLTVFAPFYNNSFSDFNNGTFSLTLEDLINKKRIKAIPISSESGDYTLIDKSFFGRVPSVSFAPSCVIFRESHEYRWLVVNNSLDYIEHPLKDTLNEYKEFFGTDLISLEISPDQPYAVALCQKELGQPHFPAVIQWNKAPAVMPVPLKLQKDEDIDYSSLLLSPSGRWAFFSTSGCSADSRHFLLYIDTDLPGGCLPPFYLNVPGLDNKATWITNPEGFIMQVGDKMVYWNLSKFKAGDYLKR
jgi:hypothetical protein